MGKISVESYMTGYLVTHDDGRDLLIQSDWDYPSVASAFGWRPENIATYEDNGEILTAGCECWKHGTDGTIQCPHCKKTASEFICDAAEFLDNGPDPVEDPGYFEDEG